MYLATRFTLRSGVLTETFTVQATWHHLTSSYNVKFDWKSVKYLLVLDEERGLRILKEYSLTCSQPS